MDFLKKVPYITVAYFFVVLLWILFYEEQLHLFSLSLQALTFGIIGSGFLYVSKHNSTSQSDKNSIKKD